jgi:hypothetical protein
MATKSDAVYRMTIAAEEILSTLELFSTIPTAQLSSGARSLHKKFQIQAAKINIGAATPAYVTTGTKKQPLTLEALGGTDEFNGTHIPNLNPADILGTRTTDATTTLPEQLDAAMEAELERLNAAMLAELAANGAGSQNVVLEERRKVPRTSSSDRTVEPTISIHDL